jgi:D-arginine dehydrogenase
MTQADFLVVGAGIAGASIAYFLAPHGRVVVLERESHPGYHSTGRSAALFSETYGPAQVRALSRASRAFLERPPAGFCDVPVLSPRPVLMTGGPDDDVLLEAELAAMRRITPDVRRMAAAEVLETVPVLRPASTGDAILEPGACDIDVHALHQGFLRGLKARGGELVCDAEVASIARGADGWTVAARTGAGRAATTREWRAAVLVDAAGAWADVVARMAGVRPIGLQPKRRAAFTFAPPEGVDPRGWPAVIALDESWYMKPDAGVLIGSPANADPVEPHDVQAEELDVAIAIDRIQAATTMSIRRPIRVWAGLRSFVADGDLVGGPAPDDPAFVWSAAQGGYGIQTSAAMGEACAALARGAPIPAHLAEHGIDSAMLSAARLHGLQRHPGHRDQHLRAHAHRPGRLPRGGYFPAGSHPDAPDAVLGPAVGGAAAGAAARLDADRGPGGLRPARWRDHARRLARDAARRAAGRPAPRDAGRHRAAGPARRDGGRRLRRLRGRPAARVREIVGPGVTVVGAELDPHHHLSERHDAATPTCW